ncbi:RND transporter, HAE1/HME family, permease protein [Burkholderiales bacterium GJ-E10]|nr:RND transporter, HAE1/HME family, permease protein [Burkholderiales bacterium GJ-E10]
MPWKNWIPGNSRRGESCSRNGARSEASNTNYLLAGVFSLATYGGLAASACATPVATEAAEIQDKTGAPHAGVGCRSLAAFYAGKAEEARKWAAADRATAREYADSGKPVKASKAAVLRALARTDERRAVRYASLALQVP